MKLVRYHNRFYLNTHNIAVKNGLTLEEVEALVQSRKIKEFEAEFAVGYDSLTHSGNILNTEVVDGVAIVPIKKLVTRVQVINGILRLGEEVDINDYWSSDWCFLYDFPGIQWWTDHNHEIKAANPATLKERLMECATTLIETQRAILNKGRTASEVALYCAYGEQAIRYVTDSGSYNLKPFEAEAELRDMFPEDLAEATALKYRKWIADNRIMQGLSHKVRKDFDKVEHTEQRALVELMLSLRQLIRITITKHGV